MSSTASLYVRYKTAEEQAFCKLFANQPYVGWKGWKLRQWHDHLPLYLNPQTAAEVIKNIETSIELRNGIAETYATALKTSKDSRHEYFVQFLNSLVRAVRLLPAGPTNTGHDQHRELKTQTIDTDEESLVGESLEEAGPANVGHEGPYELQAQTVDTGDESMGDESLDDLDRIMFQNAVQTFMLEASENWRKAGKRERPLSAASIISNMQATELKAFLSQAELLHPSWIESQDRVSWHMEDPALNFEQLILPTMRSGLTFLDLPVAVQHLVDSRPQEKGPDNRSHYRLIWKGLVDASIEAVDSSDVEHFRKIVQQKVQETLRLAEQHRAMLGMHLDIHQTVSMFQAWAQSASDILSIGQIAEFAEVQSVIVYRMILELPSMTMFAYLCEYTRIEEKQSLAPLLESWFTDTLLSKHLWWNGRPKDLRDWNKAVVNWVLAGTKGVVVTERRHKAALCQAIVEAKYRCHTQILQALEQPVSDCLERELNFPDTDRIRAYIFDTVRSILGDIGSEWGKADAWCALRMYQQCRPGGKAQLVVDSFVDKWTLAERS